MAKSLRPLSWLRAFEAAARHLSFTAAAAEIGLTQSAVSQHVKALESRLGAPLFVRLPRRLMLTDAGLEGALADLPLIEAVGTSTGWEAWGAYVGATPAPRLFVDTYGMALHLAAHGNGVALVSELLAFHALKTGRVVLAHPGSIVPEEGYYLSINDTPDAALLRDWLLRKLPKPEKQ